MAAVAVAGVTELLRPRGYMALRECRPLSVAEAVAAPAARIAVTAAAAAAAAVAVAEKPTPAGKAAAAAVAVAGVTKLLRPRREAIWLSDNAAVSAATTRL